MHVTEEQLRRALGNGATVNDTLSVDKADGSFAVGAKQTPPLRLERAALRKGEPVPLEHNEQVSLFQQAERWAEHYPLLRLMFAIPNGAKLPYTKNAKGQRFSKQATILLAEGLKAGVPDICLPVPSKGKHGLFIEMKRADHSNKPSVEQEWWLYQLKLVGYEIAVCYGASEAWNTIIEYLGIEADLANRDAGHRG